MDAPWYRGKEQHVWISKHECLESNKKKQYTTSTKLYYFYCLLFTFTFTVQFKTDDRSYWQLLGHILWANSLEKGYPSPPTSLRDFTHVADHILWTCFLGQEYRILARTLKISVAHLSLYRLLLGLECTSKESSSCTLLGGRNRQNWSSANPSMFRN